MQQLTPVLRIEDRTNRDDPNEHENFLMTIPDPTLAPRLTNTQYASDNDPAGFTDALKETYIIEDNIRLAKPTDRGERIVFVNGPSILQIRTLARGKNIITFRTPDDLWLKDSIIALMHSRISVKKCLG